jgi:hypothetical protein
MTRPRVANRSARGDSGQITAMAVVMMAALFLLAGLVLDGGLTLAARERVLGLAQEAARAGAQAVDLAVYRQNGTLRRGHCGSPEAGGRTAGSVSTCWLRRGLRCRWRWGQIAHPVPVLALYITCDSAMGAAGQPGSAGYAGGCQRSSDLGYSGTSRYRGLHPDGG